MKKPITIGKNFVGPFKDSTKELSNRFVVLETYFSSLLITNFENKPRSKRNTKKIKRAIIISEMLINFFIFYIICWYNCYDKLILVLTLIFQKSFYVRKK